MRVNELVAAPPPPSLSPLHARRGSSGRAAGRRYVYDTKGERGTSAIAMTITGSVALVAWRAMNNLGAMCAGRRRSAACREGQCVEGRAKKGVGERRGKDEDAEPRRYKPNCRFWAISVLMRGDRAEETLCTRLFACRRRCVCVLLRGPGE